jgi:hypothetical protein
MDNHYSSQSKLLDCNINPPNNLYYILPYIVAEISTPSPIGLFVGDLNDLLFNNLLFIGEA